MIQPNEALFAAGYDKGREDGIRITMTFLKILLELHGQPRNYLDDPAHVLIPQAHAELLERTVTAFADEVAKEARKAVRERIKRKQNGSLEVAKAG